MFPLLIAAHCTSLPTDVVTAGGRRKLTRASAAAGEPEKPPLSKEDRWAAIARAVEADDAEADSEDFKVRARAESRVLAVAPRLWRLFSSSFGDKRCQLCNMKARSCRFTDMLPFKCLNQRRRGVPMNCTRRLRYGPIAEHPRTWCRLNLKLPQSVEFQSP